MISLPGVSDVHVDRLLTNISIAALNDPGDYIATKVFPVIQVKKVSDKIPLYDQFAWLADEAKPRSPGTESEGSGWTVSSDSYLCENYAHHKDVPLEARANADEPYNLDEEAAMYTVDRMLMRMEVKFGTDFFVTGVWGTSLDLNGSGQVQWDVSTSPILKHVDTAKLTVGDKIVKEPNVAVLGRYVWSAIKQHPDVIGKMETTTTRIVTEDLVRALFELDRLYIGRAIKATSKQGQTLTKARVIGKNALFLYVTDRPALLTPNAGYTFYWTVLGPGVPVYTRRINMPLKQADRIESQIYYDSKMTSIDAGYMFINAVD